MTCYAEAMKFIPCLSIFLLAACPSDFYVHIDVSDAGVITGTATPAGRGGSAGAGTGGAQAAGVGGSEAGRGGSAAGVGGSTAAGASGFAGRGQGGVGGNTHVPMAMRTGVNTWYLESTWGFGSPFNGNPAWATAYANGDNIWSQAFVYDLRAYGSVLRLMDWNATNYSKVVNWSERKLPTDPKNADVYIDGSTPAVGLAYEWQFDLARRAGTILWVTLPIQANDDYFAQFAKLAHQLSSTQLIVELSNEVDGGWFSQTAYAQSQGAALGLPGQNKYYVGGAWQTYRSLQLRAALRKEFGDAAMGKDVLVARCSVGTTDVSRAALSSVMGSTKWNPTGEKFDMLCLSAYFGQGKDGSSYTLANAQSEIMSSVIGSSDGVASWKAVQKQYGIPFFGIYEGGQSVNNNAAMWDAKSDAAPAEVFLLDQLSAAGVDYFAHYTDAASCDNKAGDSCWGLKHVIGGPDSAKSLAFKNWVAQH